MKFLLRLFKCKTNQAHWSCSVLSCGQKEDPQLTGIRNHENLSFTPPNATPRNEGLIKRLLINHHHPLISCLIKALFSHNKHHRNSFLALRSWRSSQKVPCSTPPKTNECPLKNAGTGRWFLFLLKWSPFKGTCHMLVFRRVYNSPKRKPVFVLVRQGKYDKIRCRKDRHVLLLVRNTWPSGSFSSPEAPLFRFPKISATHQVQTTPKHT